MKKPKVKEIERWTQDYVTKWFLYKLAYKVNELDTIRNITQDNLSEMIGNKKAVEVIEELLIDVYKELPKLQMKVAEEDFSISRELMVYKDYDY